MLHTCHMLQLARNTSADKGTIVSKQGIIDFKYIKRLNNLQKEQCLKFANKLPDKHIFYENQNMNVTIAAQTLSAGLADETNVYILEKNLLKTSYYGVINC